MSKEMVLNGQSFSVVTVTDDEGKLQKFQTKELFKINKDQLMSEMLSFSEDFGWWTRLEAELWHQKRTMKSTMERVEADVAIFIRKGGIPDLKITAESVNSAIACDPRFLESVSNYNEVCRLSDIVSGVVSTLRTKQDMIKLYTQTNSRQL